MKPPTAEESNRQSNIESLYSHSPTARALFGYSLSLQCGGGGALKDSLPGELLLWSSSMRSINARIICMIGMNDEAFPRRITGPVLIYPAIVARVIVPHGRTTVIFPRVNMVYETSST